MGETPKIVNNMCDKAMGGILFIDEAYTLSAENDPYGKEAIDTLMKRMEDDRGKFVVIAAGYRDEMETFLSVNPGLASRFSHKMHIDDYTADELGEIFVKMAAKDNYKLSSEQKQNPDLWMSLLTWFIIRLRTLAMLVRCATCWMKRFNNSHSVSV